MQNNRTGSAYIILLQKCLSILLKIFFEKLENKDTFHLERAIQRGYINLFFI